IKSIEISFSLVNSSLYFFLIDTSYSTGRRRIEPTKTIFQQDNDPKDRANLVEKWLSQQPFEVMQ
ncbi:uncharacterized protein RHIMIDRAFT_207912, partial [Rhizopus microsporus ATCC 52813]